MKDTGEAPNLEKGVYRHYKGGLYELVDIACHTETLEWYVVYRSYARKERGLPSVWVRPYNMFVETVKPGGKTVQRFEKVDN